MSKAVHDLEPENETIGQDSESAPVDRIDSLPWLPCAISLEVAVVRFTIADLLSLTKGAIVETACHHTSDVPMRVNDVLVGWTEFEVIGERLAVRVTELA